jgi:hypothetical protein
MPNPEKPRTRVRINIEMSLTAKKSLDDLQERIDCPSISEVVRRSLSLYDYVITMQEKGMGFYIEDGNGLRERLLLLEKI